MSKITIKGCVIEDGVLVKYKGGAKKVVIPEGVTAIGDFAFRGYSYLAEVMIPEGVKSIGYESFSGCENLIKVELPNTVTSIDYGAFFYCTSLKEIVLPDSVTSIGNCAFANCSKLERLEIPESVFSIGMSVCQGCTKLSDEKGFMIIRDILDSYHGADSTVVIPERVKRIGNSAFFQCRNLTHVVIPEGVTSIGAAAFAGCVNLTSVVIQNPLTSIGTGAFKQCTKLADANGFIIVRGILNSYCGSGGKLKIPEGVTMIGDKAFFSCRGITSVVIPDGVTFIGNEAFSWCENLTSAVIPESVTSIGSEAFAKISENAQIVAPHLPIEAFQKAEEKRAAAFGFLHHLNLYVQSNILNSYQKVVIAQKKKILPVIFEEDLVSGLEIFAAKGKITSDNFEAEFMQPAQEANAVGCIAYLQELINRGIGVKNAVKHPQNQPIKDPYNAADMKKLWSYETMEDGTLMITSYKGSETEVIVPERIGKTAVTRLEDYAFATITKAELHRPGNRVAALEAIVSIQIPNSVKSIGDRAFYGCKNLTGLVIPESVEKIGNGAFWGCAKLSDADGFVIVRDVLHYYCGTGGKVKIPEGVKHIGELTFRSDLALRECNTLTSIVIPKSVIDLGQNVFPKFADHAQIVAPYLSFYVFESANEKRAAALGYLCNPDLYEQNGSLEDYQKYVVSQRSKLLSLIFSQDLPVGLTVYEARGKITVSNFEKEYLQPAQKANAAGCIAYLLEWKNKKIDPETMEKQLARELKLEAFDTKDVKKLWSYERMEDGTLMITNYKGTETEVIVPERIGKAAVTRLDDYTFAPVTKAGKSKPDSRVAALGAIVSIQIPDSVTGIGEYAFYKCRKLTNVKIPESVTSIGDRAFVMCEELASMVIPKGITRIGEETFEFCKNLTGVVIPDGVTSIGNRAFAACSKLENVVIPKSVTIIGNEAFQGCKALSSVEIPKGVMRIGDKAFSMCEKLTNVVIPESATDIGNMAFYRCENITDMVIPEGVTSIGNKVFAMCLRLTDVVIPKSVTRIGVEAFHECTALKKVEIPEGVTSIGDSAFYRCRSLESAVISDSVTTIGNSAFGKCECLTEVSLGSGVSEIGSSAFRECRSLISATIPDSVADMGDFVFRDCENLASVNIGKGITVVPGGAFLDCKRLTTVTIPDNIIIIGDSAFGRCDLLTAVTIGKNVTAIEKNAFRSCKNLHTVTVYERVTTIGEFAFRDCENLTIHGKAGSYAETYAKENNIPFTAE